MPEQLVLEAVEEAEDDLVLRVRSKSRLGVRPAQPPRCPTIADTFGPFGICRGRADVFVFNCKHGVFVATMPLAKPRSLLNACRIWLPRGRGKQPVCAKSLAWSVTRWADCLDRDY